MMKEDVVSKMSASGVKSSVSLELLLLLVSWFAEGSKNPAAKFRGFQG
jgi:hypothetical protein